jgi:hypothetical protein
MTTFFKVIFTYNCGMLGTEKRFDNYTDALEFFNDYVENFPDGRKSAMMEKVEVSKRFFRTQYKTTTITTWDE